MLRSLALIFAMLLAGNAVAEWADLPVPGPVLGLVFFLIWLSATGGPSQELERTGDGLLSILALLFVPAGVGVIAYGAAVADDFWAIALALTLGTGIAIAGAGLLFQSLGRRS